ncbi:MAG: TIM barrel protein [Candidatus Latescibacteria bacterium]|nr:TIM barrel protein [Candidatus Latescibacterota bacterium]
MRLGLVSYNLARGWDIETIIKNCRETGFEGVEARTSHAHGIEVELTAAQRAQVKERFADSGVELVGLGSAFEYDAVDQGELRQQIEGTKEYVKLASHVGAPGVKVRPNKVHVDKGVPIEKTLEQIGLSLRECGQFAQDYGVQIRLEVHGRVTCEPPHIRTILDHADHDNVYACWNSNMQDMVDGSIDANFALLKGRIGLVHITELWNDYPWPRLFQLLQKAQYKGFILAEIPENEDGVRIMRYYRALWRAYSGL